MKAMAITTKVYDEQFAMRDGFKEVVFKSKMTGLNRYKFYFNGKQISDYYNDIKTGEVVLLASGYICNKFKYSEVARIR